MAVIVCAGVPGSPGTTTTALGMALTWPRDVVLADCDREPAQAIQAGYLRGMDHGGRGLAALARMHREGRPLVPELWHHTVALSDGAPQRRFLPGFAQPAAVRLFDQVWPELADALALLDGHGGDVLVDAGRVGQGLPLPLLERADAVCLVTRSNLRALAATRLYLPLLAQQLAQLSVDRPLGLLVVGPDRPYSAREIEAQFGVACWGEVPWSPRMAAVLSDGEPEPKRFWSGGLVGQLRRTALQLFQRLADAHLRDATLLRPAHA